MLSPLCLIAALALAGVEGPTGLEVEQKALGQRRAIRRGVVTCDITTTLRKGAHAQEQERVITRTVKLWFDGAKQRSDTFVSGGAETHRDIRCLVSNRYIRWSEQKSPGGGMYGVDDHDVKFADRRVATVVDPRMVGMAPDSFANLVQYNLESFFGSGNRRQGEGDLATRVMLDGAECLQSEYERNTGATIRLVVVPAMNFAPVRIEAEFIANGVNYRDVVSVKNKFHEPSRTWFPANFRYERRLDDRIVELQEGKLTVESLNEPVSPEIFTLAGMGLPPGVHVSRFPEDEHLVGVNVWNGREVVHEGGDDETVPAAVPPPGSARPVILTFFSIVLAVIAAAALWRYFSSRIASS